jgi:hypothetical protein
VRPLCPDYHPDGFKTDIWGKHALLFDPFWYWGAHGIHAPEIADLAHHGRGESTKRSSPEMVTRLEAWLRSVSVPGVHGKPRDQKKMCQSAVSKQRVNLGGG